MKSFLVIGLNSFGVSAAKALYRLGNEVLAVDIDPDAVQAISEQVTDAVTCDCRDEAVLKSLGVQDFDTVIVALPRDQQAGTLITMILRDLGAKQIVCQAMDGLQERLLKRVGADRVVCAEADMGEKVAQSLSSGSVLDYIELSDRFSIVEINLPKAWEGKSLRELSLRGSYGLNVVARKDSANGNIDVTLSPDAPLQSSDVLVVIGSNRDISRIPS